MLLCCGVCLTLLDRPTPPPPAQVVSEGFSEDVQWHAVSLLRLTTQHSLLAQLEFKALEGIGLVQQVLRSPEAAVGKKIAEVRSSS